MRWRCCVAAGALALLTPFSVSAQAPGAPSDAEHERWLVVPARGGDIDVSAPVRIEALHVTAEALRQELSVRGKEVWPADRATERYEIVGSAPAPRVSQSDIDRWVERSRAAVRYLARTDYKAARRELKAAQRLADRAAEELNREAARAQQVLDTCLYMVRAYVETKNDAAARRQARECRQLVPRVEPSAFRHTPEVRTLLAEVDAKIAAEAPGVLQVTSEPMNCLVRVNGVELARTPVSGIELPVGTYRLQVECDEDRRGRIHRISIESGSNTFSFDARLDAAVRTRPVLHLEYASREDWIERPSHARSLARTLEGAGALIVSSVGAGEVRVDLAAPVYEPASVWMRVVDGAPETEDTRRALTALFGGRSVDFTGSHPLARPSWQAERQKALASAVVPPPQTPIEPSHRAVPRPRPWRMAGWSLFGVGVASIGTSVGLHVWRGNLGDDFAAMPASLNAAQRWNDARIGVWTTAAFGGAAVSAAMPLLLPEYAQTPWWAWASGVFGLGLTGYAIYEGVTMTNCPEPFVADGVAARACVDRGQNAGRLSLALAGAAPLLSVPLVYLIRPLRAKPSVSVSRSSAVVEIHGTF